MQNFSGPVRIWDVYGAWLSKLMAQVWVQNTLFVLFVAVAVGLLLMGSRNERWQRAGKRLRRDKLGLVSGVVIALYLLIGTLEILQLPQSQERPQESVLSRLGSGLKGEKSYSAPLASQTFTLTPARQLNAPGRHLLGTNALGDDTLLQTLKACRTALIIGGVTSAIYIPVGVLLGILAGYYRKRVDDMIQYVYSSINSIPEVLLLVAMLMLFKERTLTIMAVVLGITGWVGMCRLIRGEVMRQAERPYVAAARSIGQSHWKIITRHLLPNVMHLVLINFVLGFSGLVLTEAILSYLGVGAPVGTASWGAMINGARGELSRDPIIWWNLTGATTALFFLVLSLNLFGDALRRAFDPRQG